MKIPVISREADRDRDWLMNIGGPPYLRAAFDLAHREACDAAFLFLNGYPEYAGLPKDVCWRDCMSEETRALVGALEAECDVEFVLADG